MNLLNMLLFGSCFGSTAETTAAADGSSGGSQWWIIVIYIVIFAAIIYFLMIRPQRKQKKQQEETMSSIEPGDSVLTTSGFYGTIVAVNGDTIIVEFGNNKNCRIPMSKQAISQIEKANAGSVSQNAAAPADGANKKKFFGRKKAEEEAAKKAEEEAAKQAAEEAAKKAAEEEAAKKAAEEEAAKKATAEVSATQTSAAQTVQNTAVSASYDDVTLLAALIQCEAGNEVYDGQVAVGAVVVNRLHRGYAGSIQGVIYQSGQFGPAASGRVASVAAAGPSASCMSAAQAALGGTDNTGGATSFRNVSSGIGGTVIGNHVFF